MKTIEITFSKSLKLKGKEQYEMDSPMWSAKEVHQVDGEFNYDENYERVMGNVLSQAGEYERKVKGDPAHLRFREKDGLRYVSVTSCLNRDPYGGDPAYGVRGTEVHRIMERWLLTREIIQPDDIDIGKLKWPAYEKFIKKFGSRFGECLATEEVFFHEKPRFSGGRDARVMFDGKKAVIDWKTGAYKWEQLGAYIQGTDCEIGVFCDLKNNKVEIKERRELVSDYESFLIEYGKTVERFKL